MQFGVGQKWESLAIENLFTFIYNNKMLEPILAKQTPNCRCTVSIIF